MSLWFVSCNLNLLLLWITAWSRSFHLSEEVCAAGKSHVTTVSYGQSEQTSVSCGVEFYGGGERNVLVEGYLRDQAFLP